MATDMSHHARRDRNRATRNRRPSRSVAVGRHGRPVLILAALAPLILGGWLWFRQSSLVAVETIRVDGVHGVQADVLRRALKAAARQDTTLDISAPDLIRKVGPNFPEIQGLTVTTDFPHGVSIGVVEREPVATVRVGGALLAASSQGWLLGPINHGGKRLPMIVTSSARRGNRLTTSAVLTDLSVLGAAPRPFIGAAAGVAEEYGQVTVQLRAGPAIRFGRASQLQRKWQAAAAVLAAPSSRGASYIDVTVPRLPAAG